MTIDDYTTVQDLIDYVVEYRETCKTFKIKQSLNTKDKVINLINAILHEALELHEATLFKDEEELSSYDLIEVKKELADVMIYCIALSDYMDEAILDLITKKIRYNIERNRLYGGVGKTISLADFKEQCRKEKERGDKYEPIR